MRIKITFKYDGSKFNGFQRQKTGRSVQKEIEDALSKIYDKKIEIKGAGRTDAGVHANYQVAHFDVPLLVSDLAKKMNAILEDIYIKDACKVADDFHARKSVKKKEYVYKINIGPYKTSYNDYYYQPMYKLDLGLMKDAAKLFIGKHDFRNFVAGKRDDYVTTIKSVSITKTFGKVEIRFIGTGFYRYMVRNLVGALLEVGKIKITRNTIKEMLDNPEKKKTLPTAPACGLYLNKIWYN